MKIVIEFDETQLIDDVMANYPEAGAGSPLKCTHWKYADVEFEFHDVEEDKHYKVTATKLRKGLKILLKMVMDGKLPGLEITAGNFQDAGNWDANCSDALVQCAIFGDVIYG